jgi:hypothetical protein
MVSPLPPSAKMTISTLILFQATTMKKLQELGSMKATSSDPPEHRGFVDKAVLLGHKAFKEQLV